jgi:predicted amidohydrolase
MDPYKVGAIQLRVKTNRIEENIARAEQLTRDARRQGARLVVLPEAFSNGLNLPKAKDLAEPIPGPLSERLSRLARDEGVYLVAGLLERDGPCVYSSAVLIDDCGVVLAVYRRIYIYRLERYFLASGDTCRVVETDLGRIGLILGYDVQFPEVTRALFAQRVEILICPALLLKPFAPSIRQMTLARAAENSCYVLFCSAAGENTIAGLTFLGRSIILQSPIGLRPYCNDFKKQAQVMAEAGDEEGVIYADLDLPELRRLQATDPLYQDFQSNAFSARAFDATAVAGRVRP